MNAITFSLLASICASLSSLFFRKNSDIPISSPTGYLVLFYFSSFILSIFIFSDVLKGNVSYTFLGIGATVGTLSSMLMFFTSRALTSGPAGLTFAFQNASAIFPGLILFLFLGTDYGFSFSYFQLTGIILVLLGLFWGAKKESAKQPKGNLKWITYALTCFIIQILALTCIQGRCVLFDITQIGAFSNLSFTEADDIWFMPGLFGTSSLIQTVLFLTERRKLLIKESLYGFAGGIANFSSTGLLLLATKYALPHEKIILFPMFAVATMILCNLWANRLYKENFNFPTNIFCSCGIFMAVWA